MRNFLVISSLAILSFLLSPARIEAQELFKVNLQGDSLYRATKDVPLAFQTGPSTVYLEYTNLTREVVSMSLDTFIGRACSKYFKATLEDNRVVAINKDFVKRIQTRSGGKSYAYMIHTPTRYDLKESLPTIISRLALCQGGSEAGTSSLFVKGDSICITGGNCVFSPSNLPYVAGAGIDITGNVITNIGDPNPNDDVLKTTNHDGDVTGVYNNLTIKNGVIGVEKLDTAAVLTWVNSNVDVDTSNIDLSTLLSWLYQNIDTVDTDSQSLYLANDSLFITRGNGIPLDTIRGDAMPFGQRGETLWRDSTGWVADSTIYNDSQRVGIKTDTLFSGTLTVGSAYTDPAVTLVSDSSILQLTPGEKIYIEPSTDLVIRERGDTLGRLLIARDSLYSASFEGYKVGVSGEFSHTSGVQSMVDIGTDASGNLAQFAPQTGNGDFAFLRVSGELNADSAASGQVRGIWIQPVLTSYPQNLGTAYRAIDIASSGGIGLYQSGALVENRLRGNTMIGSTGRPLQTLDVSGTMRLRGSVANSTGLLGVKLSNGDVGYIRIGTGLVMSGDTLYATATGGGGDSIPDGTVLWSTLHWNGSEWVENDSLLVDPQGHGALGMPVDTLYSLNARKDLNVNSHVVGRGNGGVITNVVLGSPMASANLAQYNTAIGREALNANLSGGNTAVGAWAVRKHNQSGGFGHNTGIGFNSLGETTTGFSNTGIGSYSFSSNTTGNFNVGVGYNAGYSESTGAMNKNTFIGSFAGSNISAGADRNIIIGYYNFLPISNADNQLVIGNTIFGTNVGSERDTISPTGKIGIKTKTPARELHVAGELRVTNDVDTASVNKLWGSNTAGDFRRLVPGEGFSISNDTLNYGIPAAQALFVVDDGMKNTPVEYQSTLTMVGTGTVTVTLDTATNTLTFNGVAADSLGNTAGEANIGLNVGSGAQIYKTKTDTTLLFRTLVDDGLTTVTQVGDTIVINTPAQTADTFAIISDSIMLSLSSDGQSAKKIALSDISPVQSLSAGPGIALSGSADITVSAADTSETNEIQTIDTFAIVSNVLRASLSSDGQPFKSVNLAPYLDDQIVSITGGGIASVSGSYPTFSITAVEVDGSTGNEGILGVGAGLSNTATITTNTVPGNAVTIAVGTGLSISESTSSNGGTITLANTVVDTTTILVNDSILVYRSGGTELLRDTIKIGAAGGDTNFGSGTTNFYSVWSADTLKTGQIKDSTGHVLVKTRLGFGNAALFPKIYSASSGNSQYSDTGAALTMEHATVASSGLARGISLNARAALTHASGTMYNATVNNDFNPTSGNGVYYGYVDETSINQTGGASGNTVSFMAMPFFFSAASHRSFETYTDDHIAFSSTGTSDSRHAGSFRIGQHAAPARTLDVTGTLRASSNVDTATLVRLWAGNTEGDLRRVKLGTNLSISGDTLNAAGGAGNIGNGTDDYYAVFTSADTLRAGIIKDTSSWAAFKGKIWLGNAAAGAQIMPAGTTGSYDLSGRGIRFEADHSSSAFSPLFGFNSTALSANTSGDHVVLQSAGSWTPTSGSGTYAAFSDASNVGPSGIYSGVSRSFYANPFIVFGTSHRAFDVGTDNQIAFSSTGTSTSRHAGSFRIGQHAAPARTLDVTGTFRASSNVDTAALTRIWAGNVEGDLRRLKLGTNLSVSGDTLNAAGGGGGVVFSNTQPTFFVGANTAKDTITELKRDELEYADDNGITAILPLADVRIKNDTIVTLRGSHFSYFETIPRNKTLASGASDTLDIDNVSTKFDFTTPGDGSFTLVNAPDEVPAPLTDDFFKLFVITASISISADSIGDVEAAIYIDGGQIDESVVEFTAESGKKVTVHVECQEWLVNGQTIDLRIKNASGTQRTYTIERLRIGANHIKSAYKITP